VRAQEDLLTCDWQTARPLRVRMAIHYGPAQRRRGNLVGPGVSRCAKLAQVAQGGEILISDATRSLLNGSLDKFCMTDTGRRPLPGCSQLEHVWRIAIPNGDPVSPASQDRDASSWAVANPDTAASDYGQDRLVDRGTTSTEGDSRTLTKDPAWRTTWRWGMW
jgi:class 3 adenylate cyclase